MTSCPARLGPDLARDPDLAAVAPVIFAVRECAPLVHCITATVSMGIVADGLLSAGVRPMMTETLAEAPVVTTVAGALAVNLGTLSTDAMDGIPATVAAAAGGGAGVAQMRVKDASAAELLELTCAVAEAVRAANQATRVLVDDRPDVAWAARARGAAVRGAHLGQDDLPVAAGRELLGPDAVIGLTTGTLELVRAAESLRGVIDYVGAGPFRL